MKAGVIGTGKTGGEVARLLGAELYDAWDEHNPPDSAGLAEADVIIVFVPGNAAEEVLEKVLESGTPAVWGTTGYRWPENLADRVKQADSRWIIASNFSLGMNLMRRCLEILGRGVELLNSPELHIHEVHHIHKKDAPSGTALSWREWLNLEGVKISSSREGDVKGIHTLHIKTESESLWFKHEAHSRAVFAEGAIWAARYLIGHGEISPGLYSFESIVDQAFRENS
ncbi:MAG: dihydrodipicolinate reductase C-terminal domain-containing protein [Balneolaceae bacterium]